MIRSAHWTALAAVVQVFCRRAALRRQHARSYPASLHKPVQSKPLRRWDLLEGCISLPTVTCTGYGVPLTLIVPLSASEGKREWSDSRVRHLTLSNTWSSHKDEY